MAVTARAWPSRTAAAPEAFATRLSSPPPLRPARPLLATAFSGTSNTLPSVAPAYRVLSHASSATQASAAGNSTERSRCPPPSVHILHVRSAEADATSAEPPAPPAGPPPTARDVTGSACSAHEYVGTGGAVAAAGSSTLAMDHALTTVSSPAVTSTDPSAANETALTALKCAFHVFASTPVETSQTYTAPESAPAAKCVPSGDAATTDTGSPTKNRWSADSLSRPQTSSAFFATCAATGGTGRVGFRRRRGEYEGQRRCARHRARVKRARLVEIRARESPPERLAMGGGGGGRFWSPRETHRGSLRPAGTVPRVRTRWSW